MGAAASVAVGAQAVGGILGGIGTFMENEASQAAIKFNIQAAREVQREQGAQREAESERVRSANVVAIAKSGVRREGSPAEVLAANAAEIARQQKLSRLATEAGIELMQYEKKMSNIGTGISIAGQLLGTGAQSAGLAMMG